VSNIGHHSELIECNSAVEIFAPGDGGILQGVDDPRNQGIISMGKGTEEYAAFPERTKVLLVCVNKTHESVGTYDAARYSWKISPAKAEQAEYVLAVSKGLIVGVFEADKWLPARKAHFPDIPPEHANWHKQAKRFGFVGRSAPKDIEQLYSGKCVPKYLGFRGNPIRYVNF
jgi:hypothetical protein